MLDIMKLWSLWEVTRISTIIRIYSNNVVLGTQIVTIQKHVLIFTCMQLIASNIIHCLYIVVSLTRNSTYIIFLIVYGIFIWKSMFPAMIYFCVSFCHFCLLSFVTLAFLWFETWMQHELILKSIFFQCFTPSAWISTTN